MRALQLPRGGCIMLKYIAEVCAMEEIRLGDRVRMRKTHPCGSDEWTVMATAEDIHIK